MKKVVQHRDFWLPALITFVVAALFFIWELGYLQQLLPSLPRPDPSGLDKAFAIAMALLLAANVGLLMWVQKHGSCPIGAKRATKIGSLLGAFALICPACVFLPLGFLGTGIALTAIAQFTPLLKLIALILVGTSTVILAKKIN